MESVETVTILFTDLVGSTGLETRAGPRPAQELRGEHFTLIHEALAGTGGREVKNTGDGVMAAFDSASAAVACPSRSRSASSIATSRATSSCSSGSASASATRRRPAATTSACR